MSVVSLLLSGAALAMSTYQTMGQRDESSRAPIDSPLPSPSVAEDAMMRLETRLQRLELQIQTTARAGIARSGGAPNDEGEPAPKFPAPEVSRTSVDVEALLGELQENPTTREGLSMIVAGEIRKLEDQRFEERRNRFAREQEQRITQLAASAQLTPDQSEKLGQLLGAEREEVSALIERGRSEGNWRGIRSEVREVRAQTDENVGAFLDEDQLAAYREMREDEPFAGRGRRGRRRDDVE